MKKEKANQTVMPYYKLLGLEHVYLEDSYVLDIKTSENSIQIFIEVVLTEEHPQYTPPLLGEQYCYRKADIFFSSVKKITWVKKNMRPYKDALCETDYGNIDEFYLTNGHYYLSGDWGELEIISAPPVLTLTVGSGYKLEPTKNSAR